MVFLDILNVLVSNTFFMGSYSNEVFPEPLSVDEENECIKKNQIQSATLTYE